MKKKLIIAIILFSMVIAGFLVYLKFFIPNNQDSLLLRIKISIFDENNLTVKGDGVKINDDAIRVTWQGDFIEEIVIWENGKKVGTIPNEYGPQQFTVFYNNHEVGKISHFKTNSWHTHNYTIYLHFIDAAYHVGFDFDAEGHNSQSIKNIRKSSI